MAAGFPTLEVRWFRPGAAPEPILVWFLAFHSQPERVPRRVDRDLRVPQEVTSVGIKLREGGLEVKMREQEHGLLRMHARVRGVLEQWCKWRFPLARTAGTTPPWSRPDTSWVDVSKQRLVHRFSVAPTARVVHVAPGEYPSRGCVLELTEVGVGGRQWWTLCFEAFGDAATLRETFSLVTKHVLATGEPPRLDAAGSFGYPGFLEQIR